MEKNSNYKGKRINISIPANLSNELKAINRKGYRLNISAICQKAIKETITYINESLDIDSYIKRLISIESDITELIEIKKYLKNKGISFNTYANDINIDIIDSIIKDNSSK